MDAKIESDPPCRGCVLQRAYIPGFHPKAWAERVPVSSARRVQSPQMRINTSERPVGVTSPNDIPN
jgi:hypothetical protein